jgi:hypothetical protein
MFPEESIEKVFRIFVNKLLEKDKCEEGPQTADGRPRQDRLSSLSGRQAVNEWETNKRIQTADGRPRQDRLSGLSETVNEWGTNQRIQTARTADHGRTGFPACREGRPSTNGKRINEFKLRTADHGRTGFPACREGRPSTNGKRINECRPLTADHGRTGFPACREGRPSTNGKTNQRMQTADGKVDDGRWAVAVRVFQPVGMEDRQRYGERIVTVQSCIKTVVSVIARSVLCDEAIPRLSSWPDKREIASPKKKKNGSQ